MRLTLLKKMLLFILVPTLLGLGILAFVAGNTASTAMVDVYDTQMSELVAVQGNEINNIIVYLQGITNSYGDMELVHEFVRSYNINPTSPETLSLQQEIKAFSQHIFDTYRDVGLAYVVSKEGEVIGAAQDSVMGIDVSHYSSVMDALSGRRSIEVRRSQTTGNLSAYITTPIMVNNRAEGVFVVRMDLVTFTEATLENIDLTPGSTAYVYDSEFNIVMSNVSEYLGSSDASQPYVRLMDGTETGVVDIYHEGIHSRGYYQRIEIADWYIVIDVPVDELFAPVDDLTRQIYFIATLIIVVISGVIVVVGKDIATPTRQASEIASYIAEGNITVTAEQERQVAKCIDRSDEIGSLARGLSVMVSKIASMVTEAEKATAEARQAVVEAEAAKQEANEAAEKAAQARREGLLEAGEQLEGVVHIVASASEELSSQIEATTNSVNDQASRLTTAATAMEQLNETILDVARNAVESAETTDITKDKAIHGVQITQKCKDAINNVREDSIILRQNMATLAGHAQSINTVMGVINDIAEQTNLLALNAAIEAARAGEAGRGFAVVADEVRKLAEKTITSTADVSQAIGAIQLSTEQNVKQVEIAVKSIEEATDLANMSGEALQDILQMAEQSAGGVRSIATAAEEQSSTVEEMNGSVDRINTIAHETKNAMGEAAQAIVALSSQAHELTMIVQSLKNN